MNVLVDFHHAELLTSLYHLFVKRMGWTMYVPMGMDWFDRGYWRLTDRPDEIARGPSRLNLETPDIPVFSLKTEERPLLQYARFEDIKSGALKLDVIVATVPMNYTLFSKLNTDFNVGAKMVLQTGNNWTHSALDKLGIRNLLASSRGPYLLMQNCPHRVFYHQEFSLELFSKKKNCNLKSVTNLQHCMDREDLFFALEKKLPDWEFKAYGIRNRDGVISERNRVAELVKNSGFVFHVKVVDEGYGHIVHNAFACGTPVLVDTEFMTVYYDKTIPNTAAMLMTPETVIDVRGKTPDQIADQLKHWADNYWSSSEKVYQKFTEVVNFDREFEDVRKFLETLV